MVFGGGAATKSVRGIARSKGTTPGSWLVCGPGTKVTALEAQLMGTVAARTHVSGPGQALGDAVRSGG